MSAVPADLAELEALLNSLAEDQSRVENAVIRVRTTNRDEKEATTRFVAKERLAALRKKGEAPGPGAYMLYILIVEIRKSTFLIALV